MIFTLSGFLLCSKN